MTIGIAIVIAMVLYLIDRNKVWKQAAKIVGALILLAVLGLAVVFGWVKFDSWRTSRREAANQREVAAWDDWIAHLPTCKAVLTAPAGSQVGRTYIVGERRSEMIDGIDMSAGLVDFVTPDTYDKLAAEAVHDTFPCKAQWIDPQWKVVSETPAPKELQKPWLKYAAQKAEAEEQAKYCAVLKNYISVAGDGQPDTLPSDFFAKKDFFEQNCKPSGTDLPTCAEYEKQHKISPPPSGYTISDDKGVALCR